MPSYRASINSYQTARFDERTNQMIPGSIRDIGSGRRTTPDQRSSPSTLMDTSPITPGPGDRPRRRSSTVSANEIPEGGGWGELRDEPPSSPPARTGGRPGRLGDLAFTPTRQDRDYTEEQIPWHRDGRRHDTPDAPYRPVADRYMDEERDRQNRERERDSERTRNRRTDDRTSDRYDDGIRRDRREPPLESEPSRHRRSDNRYADLTATRRDPRGAPRESDTRTSGHRGSERTYDDPPAPRRDRRGPPGPPPSQGLPPPPSRAPERSRAPLPDDSPTMGGPLPHRPSRRLEATRSDRRTEISDPGMTNYITHLENQYPLVSRRQREDWAEHYANTGIMIDGQFTEEEPQPSGRRRERRPYGSHGSGR